MKTTTEPMQCEPFTLERDPLSNRIIPEPKFTDADGWIWISNADDPAGDMLPLNSTKALGEYRVGPPRPTTSRVHGEMKDLLAAGIVGLYAPPIERENDKDKQP